MPNFNLDFDPSEKKEKGPNQGFVFLSIQRLLSILVFYL